MLNPLKSNAYRGAFLELGLQRIGAALVKRVEGPLIPQRSEFKQGFASKPRWKGIVDVNVANGPAASYVIAQTRTTNRTPEKLYFQMLDGAAKKQKKIGSATDLETSYAIDASIPVEFPSMLAAREGNYSPGTLKRAVRATLATLKGWGVSAERLTLDGSKGRVRVDNHNPLAIAALVALAKATVKVRVAGYEATYRPKSYEEHLSEPLIDAPGDVKQRARELVERFVREQRLRLAVLAQWPKRQCAVCGRALRAPGNRWECEVAHVIPIADKGRDLPENGLPLCRSHHWAFDEHLWAIDPNTREVVIAKGHEGNDFLGDIAGKKMERDDGKDLPSHKSLQRRWEIAQRCWAHRDGK